MPDFPEQVPACNGYIPARCSDCQTGGERTAISAGSSYLPRCPGQVRKLARVKSMSCSHLRLRRSR